MNTNEACSILGVPPGSSPEDVKKAFRKKASETHPDKNPGDPMAEDSFKKVNAAFQHLEKHGTNPDVFVNHGNADDLAEEIRRNMENISIKVFRLKFLLVPSTHLEFQLVVQTNPLDNLLSLP